jgi:hypothetical protein
MMMSIALSVDPRPAGDSAGLHGERRTPGSRRDARALSLLALAVASRDRTMHDPSASGRR